MLLEVRIASRKTPLDGKFEISASTARRLESLGPGLRVVLGEDVAAGLVERLACTCTRSETSGHHEHHFIASELLRGLTGERRYAIELEAGGEVRFSVADDGLR